MQLDIYQVDAFSNRQFRGNAAAVVPLTAWLDDALLRNIAQENNLSETAFVVELQPGHFFIRWFSPLTEIDFCGHATLAAAFVLFARQPALTSIQFSTTVVGDLTVCQQQDWLQMSFPQRPALAVDEVPPALLQGLLTKAGLPAPIQILRSAQAWLVVFAEAATVQQLTPDFALLKQLGPWDVVVTAPGTGVADGQYDFISRYFWPANGGEEDPVTGSIHAALTPYWAAALGKTELLAWQASKRGGELRCVLQQERVLVSGQAVLYLQGKLLLQPC